MANLYIWFGTKEERRKFVGEMLGLEPLVFSGASKGTKEYDEMQKEASRCLDMMETSKKPLYDLYKEYSFISVSKLPKWDPKLPPYDYDNIFAKGFRRIYYQKSYKHRPGYWLVIQFRSCRAAGEMYDWIMERVPEERLGTNVPVPESTIIKWKLKYVKESLGQAYGPKTDKKAGLPKMGHVLKYLKDMLEYDPGIFKGDNVYLWEQAAFVYESLGDLASMEFCLKTQARLQPGDPDPFLNLGAFYEGRGYYRKAMAAYLKGLTTDPENEYIYYNLAALLQDEGNYETAIGYINEAIEANPGRMVNYKLKGDLYFNRMFYQEAAFEYKKALEKGGDPMSRIFFCECCCNLAIALGKMHKKQEALETLEKGLEAYPNDISILMCLSNLFINLYNDYEKGMYYANKVLGIEPGNKDAHVNLIKCCYGLDMQDRAVWHKKKLEQLCRQ